MVALHTMVGGARITALIKQSVEVGGRIFNQIGWSVYEDTDSEIDQEIVELGGDFVLRMSHGDC